MAREHRGVEGSGDAGQFDPRGDAGLNRGRVARIAPGSGLLTILLLTILTVTLTGPTGCMVRSDTPVVGPDSTLVYPSKLSSDVNASITFALRDSRAREAERESDRARQREITRLKKNRDKLVEMRAEQEEERAAAARLAEEKARKAEEKKAKAAKKKAAEKKKSGKKSSSGKDAVKKDGTTSDARTDRSEGSTLSESKRTAGKSSEAAKKKSTRRASRRPSLSFAAISDSLARIDARLTQLEFEDSRAQSSGWRQSKAMGRPEDERAFDLEEDARILATVQLDNVYARGRRPMTLHLIWVNPAQKKVFKKMYEYTPNDSTQKITGSFSIPPSRRSPGFYKLRVYLHRELIAEKAFELRGTGQEVPEESSGDGAM